MRVELVDPGHCGTEIAAFRMKPDLLLGESKDSMTVPYRRAKQSPLGVWKATLRLGIRGGPHSLHNLAAEIRCSRVVVDECCR